MSHKYSSRHFAKFAVTLIVLIERWLGALPAIQEYA